MITPRDPYLRLLERDHLRVKHLPVSNSSPPMPLNPHEVQSHRTCPLAVDPSLLSVSPPISPPPTSSSNATQKLNRNSSPSSANLNPMNLSQSNPNNHKTSSPLLCLPNLLLRSSNLWLMPLKMTIRSM